MKHTYRSGFILITAVTVLQFGSLGQQALAHVGDGDEVVSTGLLTVLQSDDFSNGRHEILFSLDETGTGRKFHVHFDQIPWAKLSTGAISS